MDTTSTILVTGATGFTGPFVVRALAERFPQARLRCFVRRDSNRQTLNGLPVEFAQGDLHDSGSLLAALDGVDTLVNLASLGFDWNEALFAAIRRSRLRRGIFLSTTAILTKLPVASRARREQGEQLVRESGLDWTILRPTMIYGTERDRNMTQLIRFIERSPVVPLVAPRALQQPVHVEDVASAVASCLARAETIGRTYNLSGREPLSFESLVRQTIEAIGRRRMVVRLPIVVVLGLVRLYGCFVDRPRVTVEQVRRLQEAKAFDHNEARRDFGFCPRSFAEGIRQEILSMRSASHRGR